jgi:tetratricopeptide (TPR) repeat protein
LTVRVKNKYLVIAALILVVFVGLGYAAGGDLLFLRAETARRNQDYVKAFANYEALIERYPQHRKVPDALYWSADLLPSQSVFFAKFFPSSSSVSRRTGSIPEPQAGAMTREERYWHIYNDHPKHWSARHVIFRLAEIYRSKDPQMAETLYLQTMEDPRSVNRVEAAQHLIEMYVRTERFQEALEIVHYCQAHLPGHLPADIQMALGDIYAAMGDIESAQAAYEQVIPILEGQFEQFPLYASDKEGALRSVEGTVSR